jgi:hypothetical protein
MIAGTKAQAVIAIIEKYRLNYKYSSEITLDMTKHGIDCQKCFPNATRVIDRLLILLFKFWNS